MRYLYALPSEYVKKENNIQDLARSCHIEDDGDLVSIADTLNDNHLNRKGFLPLCPREGESGVISNDLYSYMVAWEELGFVITPEPFPFCIDPTKLDIPEEL